MTASPKRLWIQEQRTYIVHCWECQRSIPITVLVNVSNEGHPIFSFGLSVELKNNLPTDWKFEEVRTRSSVGTEEWRRKFLCKSCWLKEPVNDH